MKYKLILLLILFLFCCCSRNKETSLSGSSENLPEKGLCAHRGAMSYHPENTIPALLEAVRLGAQMIEFDVRLTKDKVPILMHDSSVDRTTDGRGNVSEMTLIEIKKLDCGSWMSENFTDLRVPTFKEALSILPNNIWLNIHLKGGSELGRITAEIITAEHREYQSIFACDSLSLLGINQVSTELITCSMERRKDRSEYIERTIKNGHLFIQLLRKRNNNKLKSQLELLKKNNVKVNYYGTDSQSEIKSLLNSGIDFILVDSLSKSIHAIKDLDLYKKVI